MRKFYAIIQAIATIFIAIVGFQGYSDGSHVMTWLGIRLSETGFMVLLLALVVFDIFSLKSAFGADKAAEKAQEESLNKAREATPLTGEPCEVTLTRLSSAIGSAMGVRVYLNGQEQEVLKNGKTVRMSTQLAENELTVRYNADGGSRSINFTAEPGGQVRITLKYTGAVLTIADERAEKPGEADEKGRYRPLRRGYVLWSIINMPIYLLGLVPLFKTLRAAKEPYEDVANNLLKSAKIWNIVLSCLLLSAVISVVIMISRLNQ